jgi:DNA invertase Pin-like site-specific DNA recombinase
MVCVSLHLIYVIMAQAIAYYRVSTDKQGEFGLGMQAQQQQVEAFAKANNLHIIQSFTEVQSGKRDDRAKLWEAIDQCKKQKCTLIIAKLDRLSRSVSFVAKLMDSKVDFKCVDMPQANTLMLHIMAAFAQHEREQISARTKAGLAATKANGTQLGKKGIENAARFKQQSMDHARLVAPIFQQLHDEGYTTIRELVAELNARDVPGPMDNQWNVASVSRYKQKVACF